MRGINPNALSDDGMTGQHTNDRVMLRNAHPHQAHSVGYDNEHGSQTNHGIQGFSVIHPKRDKAPEHHPPKGLMDHTARKDRSDMVDNG
jgi:hypothetical protein